MVSLSAINGDAGTWLFKSWLNRLQLSPALRHSQRTWYYCVLSSVLYVIVWPTWVFTLFSFILYVKNSLLKKFFSRKILNFRKAKSNIYIYEYKSKCLFNGKNKFQQIIMVFYRVWCVFPILGLQPQAGSPVIQMGSPERFGNLF